MSVLRLPAEIVALLVEQLDVESIFNFGLSSRCLSYILFDKRMCRLALMKAGESAEAREARTTGDYARAFRRLAKRRIAVRRAEPWTVAIVAMAERLIYTKGSLCYTVNDEHLRVLNLHRTPTAESTVNVPQLLQLALPDFDPLLPYTFEPIYCAEGIVSCRATQALEGYKSSWLVVFELRGNEPWFAIKRLCAERQIFVRNDRDYLFCGTKSHARIDGSYRWGLQRLDLATHEWSDAQLILWDFDGSNLGSDICFEIIDGYFYCLSNTMKTQTDLGIPNCFYQVLRFPVSQATHQSWERPPMRHLWRRHDSEGQVDERWTSLQLSECEETGKLFIIETRREWSPGNSGSQRTCYKKELRFEDTNSEQQSLPTPPNSTHNSPTESEWDSEKYFEDRPSESIHVGDDPTDVITYTLQECFIRSYNPSCDSFVDLVCEAYTPEPLLQLRVRPKTYAVRQEPDDQSISAQRSREKTVRLWPRDPRPRLSSPAALAQLHDITNPVQPLRGIEWAMDERILVYSPTHMASGQLRPVILVSFDPALELPGLPKYPFQTADAGRPGDVLPDTPPASQEPTYDVPDVVLAPSCRGSNELLLPDEMEEGSPRLVSIRPPLYRSMSMGNGAPHGFDMSYSSSST
ncbi:hypothetical protein FDECE_13138 [Fusarium decemcellulare]|nr:hypothetical protein FDECE_13138 [Fusarium decemcellulare]